LLSFINAPNIHRQLCSDLGILFSFLPRNPTIVQPMLWHGVCMSLCLSCSCIVLKWLNVSSNFFYLCLAPPF